MGVTGAVCEVDVCAEGKAVEDACDVVLFNRGQESFVRCCETRARRRETLNVGSVDIFGRDKLETLLPRGSGRWLDGRVQSGLPDHVAGVVTNLQEYLNNVI